MVERRVKYYLGVALAIVGVSVGLYQKADACSPAMECFNEEFLPRYQAPANFEGGYWVPTLEQGAPSIKTLQERFRLTRLDGEKEVDIPVVLEKVEADEGSPSYHNIYFWKPLEALEPGATYRVRGANFCEDPPEPVMEHVFKATEPAPFPEKLGRLRVDQRPDAPLEVDTTSGSCSWEIAADQALVALLPSEEVLPWWELLIFTTYVDGERWEYSRSLAGFGGPVGEGLSGRGRALIYAGCEEDNQGGGLSEGTHTVQMKAHLPGSEVEIWSDSLEVDLSCDDVWPVYRESEEEISIYWKNFVAYLLIVFALGACFPGSVVLGWMYFRKRRRERV
ncbi:hypothetical protein FRC98_16955 [Lujinxingia vulgaris]|uniref:Uncharacterized protein n=1 Tax=Lujinxingia vulgaris TaxID=2600176 RepID=A0A5C6XDI8_9DELT|nr:hypothetical protein [Lujinxingia vulgaris]TXD35160.1 hypothetical protein FRC98_16955 [Lujinxingia vulgaris]